MSSEERTLHILSCSYCKTTVQQGLKPKAHWLCSCGATWGDHWNECPECGGEQRPVLYGEEDSAYTLG